MTNQELELLFPDQWESRLKFTIPEKNNQIITPSNCKSLCEVANQQFEYLDSHKHKSGLYFVDWRLAFWDLNHFLMKSHSIESNNHIELFKEYFKNSTDIMYGRFAYEENRKENKDKNVMYGDWVYYIPALQIDGIKIKKEEVVFPEYITQIDDPVIHDIPNSNFLLELQNIKGHEFHFTYPLKDKERKKETKDFYKTREIEEWGFNDLFEYLQIDNNKDLVTLYNKIYNSKIIDIFNNPVTDLNPVVNEILIISNGYLIYHHQLELIVKYLFNISEDDAINLRRNWNKKLVDKIQSWKEIEFDKGRSLYNLIISKALLKTEYPPLLSYNPVLLFK